MFNVTNAAGGGRGVVFNVTNAAGGWRGVADLSVLIRYKI